MNLNKLTEYFPASDIEFRVGATSGDKKKGLALPYVTNRAIQKRLDEVCGPENWKNEFISLRDKGQLCGISIKIDGEWITKWDGAEDTQTEPIKGGLSGAMKRAGVQWGIGRYLYEVPAVWGEIIPCGRSFKFKNQPTLPKEFLPSGDSGKYAASDVADKKDLELYASVNEDRPLNEAEKAQLLGIVLKYDINTDKVKKWGHVARIEDLSLNQYKQCLELWQSNIPGFEQKSYNVPEAEKKRLETLNKGLKK